MIENIQQLSRNDRKHTKAVQEIYKTYNSCLGKIENILQLSKKDRKHTAAVYGRQKTYKSCLGKI